jgi:hypothetical protein
MPTEIQNTAEMVQAPCAHMGLTWGYMILFFIIFFTEVHVGVLQAILFIIATPSCGLPAHRYQAVPSLEFEPSG